MAKGIQHHLGGRTDGSKDVPDGLGFDCPTGRGNFWG